MGRSDLWGWVFYETKISSTRNWHIRGANTERWKKTFEGIKNHFNDEVTTHKRVRSQSPAAVCEWGGQNTPQHTHELVWTLNSKVSGGCINTHRRWRWRDESLWRTRAKHCRPNRAERKVNGWQAWLCAPNWREIPLWHFFYQQHWLVLRLSPY